MNEKNTNDSSERQREEELSAYEKIFEDVKDQLGKLTESVDADALKDIIDKSTDELRKIESHSREAVVKASEALRKDLMSTAEHTKPLLDNLERSAEQAFDTLHRAGADVWTHLAANTEDSLERWRDWTGGTFEVFLKQVAAASGKLGEEVGSALTYHTGEITHGGTFRCVACESKLTLKKPGHLPPCPKCAKTSFRRA